MLPSDPRGLVKRSVSERIQYIEVDIARRRSRVKQRKSEFTQHLRQRLLSPAALLAYAGFGVAAGLLLRRPSCVSDNKNIHKNPARTANANREAPQTGRMEQLFANAFKIVAMARTLSTILPAPKPRPCPTVSNPDPLPDAPVFK